MRKVIESLSTSLKVWWSNFSNSTVRVHESWMLSFIYIFFFFQIFNGIIFRLIRTKMSFTNEINHFNDNLQSYPLCGLTLIHTLPLIDFLLETIQYLNSFTIHSFHFSMKACNMGNLKFWHTNFKEPTHTDVYWQFHQQPHTISVCSCTLYKILTSIWLLQGCFKSDRMTIINKKCCGSVIFLTLIYM
jgi:hypothetical protein